uniref:Uncharacterized protein n=1 Tax=Caenorhabditis japonica TaxID=281687 RepID=A0A8R1HL04_CAEJA
MRTLLLLLFAFFGTSESARLTPCLDGCSCDATSSDTELSIRCDGLGLDRFPLPHSAPLRGYQYLALTCNNLASIPDMSLIKASFPDLQGIDVEGNPRINCTQLSSMASEIAVLSDCNSKDPVKCDQIDKSCDWKCRTLTRLKQMWAEFKSLVARKAKEWQAEEAIEATKSWFSAQFKKFKIALGELSD